MKTITVCTLYKPVFVVEINTFIRSYNLAFSCNINLQSQSQTPWLTV